MIVPYINLLITNLEVSKYELADLSKEEISRNVEVDEDNISELKDHILSSVKGYEDNVQEAVKNISKEHDKTELFVKGIRNEFLEGKIKTDDGGRYSKPSMKTVSLKSAIKRVGKEIGFDTYFTEYTNYGLYRISSGLGVTYDLALTVINEEKEYEDMLKTNRKSEVIMMLIALAKAQRHYRDLNDDYYKHYKEIRDFQKESGIWISTDIANRQDVSVKALDAFYKAFKEVEAKYAEILEITEGVKAFDTIDL